MQYNTVPVQYGNRIFRPGDLVDVTATAQAFGFAVRTYATWVASDNLHALGDEWLREAWQAAKVAYTRAGGSTWRDRFAAVRFAHRHPIDRCAVEFQIVRGVIGGGADVLIVGAGS